MFRSDRFFFLLLAATLLAGAACTSRLISDDEPAAKPAADSPTAPASVVPAGKNVTAAVRELRDIAERSYDEAQASFESNEVAPIEVYQASRRWLEQELALAAAEPDKIPFYQAHLDRMRDMASFSLWRTSEVEYYVAEAESWLHKLLPEPAYEPIILARKALQGEWEVVSADEDGARLKKPDLKTLTFVGRRGEFVFRLGSARALITLDPTVTPAQFDVFGLSEAFPFGGRGIYKLDGDRLTICWAASGEPPTAFVTRPGDDTRLYVLKRSRAQEKQPAE